MDYKVGDKLTVWITGMVPRYEAEVVQEHPLRLRVLDPSWPADLLLKAGDYGIIEAIPERVLTSGPFAGSIVTIAPSTLIDQYEPEITKLVEALGFSGALVTDESRLCDFSLEPIDLALVEQELGLEFAADNELLVDIAVRMRGTQKGS